LYKYSSNQKAERMRSMAATPPIPFYRDVAFSIRERRRAPCSSRRYIAVGSAGDEDEVSTRYRPGACLATAELEERLSSAGFASSQLCCGARIAARYYFPPSRRLSAVCQSEKGLKRKGTRD
jgi:hypothetical protein